MLIQTTYRDSNNRIRYDHLIKQIHVVNKNNYYMNYGLWETPVIDLMKANRCLCDFIYKKAGLNKTGTFTILDVGCGYGRQDLQWISRLSDKSTIIAVDVSKKQIDYANRKRRKRKIPRKQLQFIEGDAHHLTSQFPNEKFQRILSVESAFHYDDRCRFFRNVSRLLTVDGLFIISDIVLRENYQHCGCSSNLFIQVAADFLCIPEKNWIPLEEWKKNIQSSGLEMIECHDITEKTFVPYYKHFFENYIRNKGLPSLFSSLLFRLFNTVQPFMYVVAVCKKSQ